MGFVKSRSQIVGPAAVSAPSSGTALTINGSSSIPIALFTGPAGEGWRVDTSSANGSFAQFYNNGTFCGYLGSALAEFAGTRADFAIGCANGSQIVLGFGSTVAITMTSTGAVVATLSPLNATTTRVATGLAGFRSSDNTATSNTTLTADAQLTLTFNETGHFAIEMWLAFWEATTGTGGFQFDLNSGTSTVGGISYGVDGFATAALGNAGVTSVSTATSAATIGTSASAPSWFLAKGWMNITGTGTRAIRWAQNSTSVNTTTLLKGSYFMATKIG